MHRQRTPARRTSLLRAFLLTAVLTAAVFGTVVMTVGSYDWRHVIGFLLGIVLIGRLVVDLLQEIDPPAAPSPGEEVTGHARERMEIMNTASWRRLGAEHPTLVIRHDPISGAYHVRGELAGVVFLRATRWQTPSRLYMAVSDAEAGGLRPDSDEGTRVVRARLGLPEWYDPHARMMDPVANNKASSVLWTQS